MLTRTPLKRSRRKAVSAAIKRHWSMVAAKGCCVCGGEAEIHHVTACADRMGRLPRSDYLVVGLCPLHHRGVGETSRMLVSVESLNHRGFYREHGIDLLALAERLWAESEQLETRRAA